MFGDSFRDKRFFITGHTGFKGSWLTLWLSLLGAEVRGYSLDPPSSPNMFEGAGLHDVCSSVHGDIRDASFLARAMQKFSPDVVVHMAAQPLVRQAYADPLGTVTTNIVGTASVLEAVRQTDSVKAVINVTSDKCYENRETGIPFKESDPMGGGDPYSASKGCAELIAASWAASFFRDNGPLLASVRAGNVIGGGDFGDDRLIPDMFRAFTHGQPVSIRSPQAIRPWQFVLEPLSGYLAIAENLLEGRSEMCGGWNFAPDQGDAWTVGKVVREFAAKWGDGAAYEMDSATDHPHEASALRLDCSKAKQQLGWSPRIGVSRALDWSVEWYAAWHTKPGSVRVLSEEQIRRFEDA